MVQDGWGKSIMSYIFGSQRVSVEPPCEAEEDEGWHSSEEWMDMGEEAEACVMAEKVEWVGGKKRVQKPVAGKKKDSNNG